MAKYQPGDMLKFLKTDILPEEYVLILSVKDHCYTLFYFDTGMFDTFGCAYIDSRTCIELVK